jgi:hypothetical protein
MRVLVCGGRDYDNAERVSEVLTRLHRFSEPIDAIIEGAATGADRLGRDWAEANGIRVESYPANWGDYGTAAGPIRNAQMIEEGRPRLVIAFPGGKGTRNMIKVARKAGVEVIEIAP